MRPDTRAGVLLIAIVVASILAAAIVWMTTARWAWAGAGGLMTLFGLITAYSKPYQKGITSSEWRLAHEQLARTGEFSRAWFNETMPACAKEGGCNFTTIGGIFQLLGEAEYQRGIYRRLL